MTSISPSYPGLDPNAIVGRLTTITKDEDLEALRSAAANPEGHAIPENVWGQIVVGGEVVAEIYRNGAFTYTGAGHLDIDTSQPLKDIASDLKRAIGGYFQPGPPSDLKTPTN